MFIILKESFIITENSGLTNDSILNLPKYQTLERLSFQHKKSVQFKERSDTCDFFDRKTRDFRSLLVNNNQPYNAI